MAIRSMALSIRSSLLRLVFVAGLAVTLIGGSIALSTPSEASAAKYSRSQALQLSQIWLNTGDIFYALGNYVGAANAYGKAAAYADFC
jgi:hypothetical protein